MKTLVIGLGNPVLGDYGVGWKVAKAVKCKLASHSVSLALGEVSRKVDVGCLSLGGISLMEHLIGYDCAILIDAFALDEPLGSILILKLSDLPHYSAFHTAATHHVSLQNAIEFGRSIGAKLPEDIHVIGIATKPICNFSKKLSSPVAEAVPQAALIALDLLDRKYSPVIF